MEQIGLESVLKDSGFNAGMAKMDSVTKQTSGILTSFGNTMTTAVGTAMGFLTAQAIPKVVDALGGFIKSAAEAEKIEKALDVALEATGGVAGVTKEAALELANGFAQLTTFEDDAVVAAEAILLRFKGISKETFPQATELTLDLATALKIDLSSAAKLLGKALEDPETGINKLRVAGVNLTDAQEKQVKAMVKAGDTAGAQKLIMDELAKSVGGAAKAAGSTAEGQWTIFQNQLGNLGETIGAAFLPLLTDLVKTINKDIMPAFQAWIQDAMPQIQAALKAFGDLIVKNWPQIQAAIANAWAVIQPILVGLGDAFGLVQLTLSQLVGAVQTGDAVGWLDWTEDAFGPEVGGFIIDLADAFYDLSKTLKSLWATAKPILEAIFKELSKFWKEVQPKLIAAWEAISNAIKVAWDFIWNRVIKPIVTAIAKFIEDHHEEIQDIIVKVMTYLKAFIDTVWTAIQGIVKVVLDLMSGNIEGAAKDWDETMRGVMNGLKTMFSAAWEAIKSIFSLALGALVTAVTNKAGEIATAMTNAIQGAVNAITAKLSSFVSAGQSIITSIVSGLNAVGSTIASTVSTLVSAAANIAQSVWNLFTSVGSSIVSTIRNAIADPGGTLRAAVGAIVSAAASLGQEVWNAFSGIGSSIITAIRNSISDTTDSIRGAIESIVRGAANLGQEVWNAFISAGGQIISSIVEGLWNGVGALATAISNVINQALGQGTSNIGGGGGGGSGVGDVLPIRLPGAFLGGGNATTVNNYFNLTTNSIASASSLSSDFGIMRSLAGV